MNSKLKRSFNIREARIIIQSQFFDWGEALMRLFWKKKVQEIGLLETKCSHKKMNLSIKNIITDRKFILSLIKIKKHYHFGHYNQVQVVMEITVLKWYYFVIYVYSGINFVKVNFDKYYFKFVVEKMDEYY